jgi:hypothetical protein
MASTTGACGGCDRRWTSLTECHCAACHRHFVGVRAFDQHRRDVRGKGTCLDPSRRLGSDGQRLYHQVAGVWTTSEDREPRGIALQRKLERYERERQ